MTTFSIVIPTLLLRACPTNIINCLVFFFKQGNYNLPQTEFDVDVELFPPGDYHAVANITNNNNFVTCVELFVTFG